MSTESNGHLSVEQLDDLVEGANTEGNPVEGITNRTWAEVHAASCDSCGRRLRAHRDAQAVLRRLLSPVATKPTPQCPAEQKWLSLAASVLPQNEAAELLEHAAQCDHCGPLLQEAMADLSPEFSPEEQKEITGLESARPEWQRALAHRLAGAEPVGAMAGSGVVKNPRRPRFLPAWAWGTAVAAIAVIAGIVIWSRSGPSLQATNQLIARAYTEQRPFIMRQPEAGYGPVRQKRGASDSRLDEPPSLLEAEVQIARRLAQDSADPGWLQAKARVDLFEGNYEDAVATLQTLLAARPSDTSAMMDLASAYFERAEATGQAADYEQAQHYFDQVLSATPDNGVALFNRALVLERQQKYSDAMADWQHYLRLDPASQWAVEARKHLSSDEQSSPR